MQAHCTFLDQPALAHIAKRGTSVAHCPLSNAYFSAQPFRLREALENDVKVGLGTDIAGGYHIDIMSSMRQAVAVSRMREGGKIMGIQAAGATPVNETKAVGPLSIDWVEALYLATRGGAIALGLQHGAGTFTKGAPFDAQCSKCFRYGPHIYIGSRNPVTLVQLVDPTTGTGIGPLDFLADEQADIMSKWVLTPEALEKWWCLGDVRNRLGMWVQGKELSLPSRNV